MAGVEAQILRGAAQALALDRRIRNGHGVEQHARIGMAGIGVDLGRVPDLDDLARIHHRHAMGDFAHNGQVMGDEEVGEAEPLLQRLQQVDDLRLGADVERRDRLVADHEVRIDRESPRDDDALALAAGEFVRIAMDDCRVHADQFQELGDAILHLRWRDRAMHLEGLGQRLADGHARMQARIGILQHELQVSAHGAQLAALHGGQVPAEQADRAGGGFEQLQHGTAGRGLARAGLADEAQGLPGQDGKAGAIDGAGRPEIDGKVVDFEDGGWRGGIGCHLVHLAAPALSRRGTASSKARV